MSNPYRRRGAARAAPGAAAAAGRLLGDRSALRSGAPAASGPWVRVWSGQRRVGVGRFNPTAAHRLSLAPAMLTWYARQSIKLGRLGSILRPHSPHKHLTTNITSPQVALDGRDGGLDRPNMGPAAAPAPGASDGPPPPQPETEPEPPEEPYVVPPELIAAFKRDGVVVLPGVFSAEQVAAARAGMAATLAAHGVVRMISDVWTAGGKCPSPPSTITACTTAGAHIHR